MLFSYFFIKTSLVYDLNNIMNFIYNNDHSNFNDMIKKSINNNEFIDLLNSTSYDFNKNNFVANTLRMTCHEYF